MSKVAESDIYPFLTDEAPRMRDDSPLVSGIRAAQSLRLPACVRFAVAGTPVTCYHAIPPAHTAPDSVSVVKQRPGDGFSFLNTMRLAGLTPAPTPAWSAIAPDQQPRIGVSTQP